MEIDIPNNWEKIKKKMTISSFFFEIRSRLFYFFCSFCSTFLISYLYSFDILFLIVQPFFAPKFFIFTDIAEALSSTIRVCIFITFHMITPFFVYQCWAFAVPGLYEQERKKFTFSVFVGFFFFLFQCGFIFLFLLPDIFQFLLSFEIKKEILTIQLEARIQSYVYFTFHFYIYLLCMFQIPLIIYLFFRYELFTPIKIAQYRNYFYFFSVLLAAFISPPDFFYQVTISLVLNFLYEIGIWLGFIYQKTLKMELH